MSFGGLCLWEFNQAIYHTNNDPEADAKIERLKQKYGVYSAAEFCRGICEKYWNLRDKLISILLVHHCTQGGTEAIAVLN